MEAHLVAWTLLSVLLGSDATEQLHLDNRSMLITELFAGGSTQLGFDSDAAWRCPDPGHTQAPLDLGKTWLRNGKKIHIFLSSRLMARERCHEHRPGSVNRTLVQ